MKESGFKKVVGIQYKKGEGLPKVILKGGGKLADEMLAQQKTLRRPLVVKDEALLNQLYKMPIDAEISPDLFGLVAILLVHVFAIDEKNRGV